MHSNEDPTQPKNKLINKKQKQKNNGDFSGTVHTVPVVLKLCSMEHSFSEGSLEAAAGDATV